jgi:WD40 repeat protein
MAGTGLLPCGKVWDAASGKELWLIRQPGGVAGVAFSPKGDRLATAGSDRITRIWDAPAGKELLALHGHGSVVSGVAFSPDGRFLVTASNDQTARVWDAREGRLLRTYRGHTQPLVSVAVSPEGELIATAAQDGSVKLWDATQDQEARSFALVNEGVTALAFEPGGERLAVGASGLRIWDLAAWQQARDFRNPFLNTAIFGVAYSSDGRRLVSVALTLKGQSEVTVRDAGARKPRTFTTEHMAIVTALSPNGRFLVLKAEVWDLDAGKPLFAFNQLEPATALGFSPDGKRLAVAAIVLAGGKPTGKVMLREVAARGEITLTLPGVEEPITAVAFRPDSRQVLASGMRRVYVWDAADGQPAGGFALNAQALRAAFSPDGKRLATSGEDGRVTLWDVATGQELLALPAFSVRVTALAFSPDGRHLGAGGVEGNSGVVKVWDATPLPR